MSRELRVSSRAEADVAATFDWYQLRGVDLGLDFVRCVDATMERIRITPKIFRQCFGIVRLAMTPRFPYAVYLIWEEAGDFISIRRVLHLSQNVPAYLEL